LQIYTNCKIIIIYFAIKLSTNEGTHYKEWTNYIFVIKHISVPLEITKSPQCVLYSYIYTRVSEIMEKYYYDDWTFNYTGK